MARSREGAAAAACAAALIALAVLVERGALTGIDRYAVEHLMPWLRPSPPNVQVLDLHGLLKPETRPTVGGTLVALWEYPASPFLSALIVLACGYLLERRGRRREAIVLCALWVVANAIELAVKLALERPSLGVAGFDHSFPSGHTVRSWVVVAAVGSLSRRAGLVAAVWAAGVAVALVALGDHTPSDVAGGTLLAGCLIAAGRNLDTR